MGEQVHTYKNRLDCVGTDYKGKHGYLGNRNAEVCVEGGGGGDRYPDLNSGTIPRFWHGFCAGRGTGTTVMELNITQELASVDQYPLFLVLLDLSKYYDNLDHGRMLKTLAEYDFWPHCCALHAIYLMYQDR